MGKVDVWLKRSYIIAAALIGAISALLLGFTLFSHGYLHEDEEIEHALPILHVMYVFSILTIVFTILGVFGTCKEKKWPLILFAVGMILGSLFMTCGLINAVAARPRLTKDLKKHFLETVSLSNSSGSFLENLNAAQNNLQCCGLTQGYVEWGYNIPESCLCAEDATEPCVAAPRNSSLFEKQNGDEPVMIYKEPCISYLIDHTLSSLGIVTGVMLGVTLLWVLAVVLCIIILCRLSRKAESPTVVYSQEAKAGNYLILEDPEDLT